ncbi:MAG: hypothetical protein O2814_05395 [Bacteroidetes bacterium]|nr:hypothetical protein [Bacteroidota bacterium]
MGYRRIIGVVIALNFWVLGLSQTSSASDSVINKQFHIVQPYLFDAEQTVVQDFGAQKTPYAELSSKPR